MKRLTLPKPIGTLMSALPHYPHSLLFTQAANMVLSETLRSATLHPLHGKQISIRVTDASLSFHFTLGPRGMRATRGAKTPDLTISACAQDFILLATRKEDPDTLFFSRRLLMEGDTELGLLVKNTLDALELPPLDWRTIMPARVLDGFRARMLRG